MRRTKAPTAAVFDSLLEFGGLVGAAGRQGELMGLLGGRQALGEEAFFDVVAAEQIVIVGQLSQARFGLDGVVEKRGRRGLAARRRDEEQLAVGQGQQVVGGLAEQDLEAVGGEIGEEIAAAIGGGAPQRSAVRQEPPPRQPVVPRPQVLGPGLFFEKKFIFLLPESWPRLKMAQMHGACRLSRLTCPLWMPLNERRRRRVGAMRHGARPARL